MDTNSLVNQSNEEFKMKTDMTRGLRWGALVAVLALSMVAGVSLARALELPQSVCFSLRHDIGAGGTGVGDPSYFDTTVYLASGPLTFDGWCADVRNSIWAPPANEPPYYYTGNTYRWDDPSVQFLGVVRYPENLDLVLYLINQRWPGKLSPATGELYTGGDVQRAIWALLDDWQGTTYLGPWDETRVQEIVNDARSHGEGFVPKCGQLTGVFLNPIGAGCAPYTPITQSYQFTFIVVPFECESIPPSCSVPSVAICEGDLAIMQVTVTNGTAPFHYAWTVPAGAINPGDVASFYANVAGVYSVVVTDADGLTTSCQGELTVNLKPKALVVKDAKKCADDPTPLILTVTHDPVVNPTYLWSPGGETTQSIQVSPATTTTYTVKVTSEAGCWAEASGTVTVNPKPTVRVNSAVICEGEAATLTATAQGATSYLWSNGATTPSIQVSPNTTTTYTVTVTSAEGCWATASGTVTVNPKPKVTVDSKAICVGESATLTAIATGATSYRWNNGATTPSIQVSPTTTTTYTVTVTSEAGCTATASGTVTVNPKPTVTVDSKTICAGEPATLTATASAGVTFLWSNGATTPSITVYPTTTTTYTVTVKSAAGCTATASGTVTVSPAVCVPSLFTFSTSSGSATYGTLGNIRTFTTTNGISVKASAFSRTKGTSGTWAKAWLGQYSGGLGVTDNSEGTGGNNTHTVDNTGQDNFVLFEFSQPVVLKRAYLGYVVNDSDLSLWIGTFNDPFNNHLTLSDAVLSSFAYSEENLTSSTSTRWANLNAGEVVGNAVVIAALVTDTSPEDYFKIALLDICVPSCEPLALACVSANTGKVGVAYSSALTASGGTSPYTYSIEAGSLPPGLTLEPTTGAITGTPTAAGTFPFIAKVTDSLGLTATTGSGGCSITVEPGCLGSICGMILRDCNADASLASEASLVGWTVTLKNAAGSSVIATTTTDATGSYCFSNLVAGTYQVVVTAMANYSQTVDPDSTKDGKTSVTLASCQNKTGVNFGYTGTAPAVYLVKTGPASAKVGDTVTYTFAVTNTGNTCLYGGMSVTDPMFGGTIWHQTPVVPGEGYVFTKTYVVKSTDCTPLVNTATAVGHPPGNLPMVSHSSTWTIVITAPAPVPAPTGLKAVAGCAKVTLTWNAVAGATSYKVKRALTASGPFSVIKSGLTSPTYTDSSLVNGKLYYYVVSAVVGGVESPNCSPVAAVPSAGLPSPWQSRDIGKVAAVGSSSYNSGTAKFTVVGSGADIWSSADEFQYMYQEASGNCSIVAKVESVGNTDPWAKAGVMIRETLTTGSKHASVFVTPNNGVAFQSRDCTGGGSVNANTIGLAAPYWVKIVRSGNTFTAYRSSTGSSWTYIGARTISMASNVYIGVAVTSHKDGTLSSAVISSITATP